MARRRSRKDPFESGVKPKTLVLGSILVVAISLVAVICVLVWVTFSKMGDDPFPDKTEFDKPKQNLRISSFRIAMPAKVSIGEILTITIVAVNEEGSTVSTYTGTVNIKSNHFDLPARSKFLPGDVGVHHYISEASKEGIAYIEVEDVRRGIKVKSGPIVIESSE